MHTINDLSSAIIGAAIEVHHTLGPGLLESAYEQCLAQELSLREIPFERQKPLPVHYIQGNSIGLGYRLDFLVAGMVLVEVKAIDALLPIHQAQLLSYLKLGRWRLGLLINFHVPLLREGIKRVVLGLDGSMETSPVKMVNSLPLCGEYFWLRLCRAAKLCTNWLDVEFGYSPPRRVRRGGEGCGINKSREATEEAADERDSAKP